MFSIFLFSKFFIFYGFFFFFNLTFFDPFFYSFSKQFFFFEILPYFSSYFVLHQFLHLTRFSVERWLCKEVVVFFKADWETLLSSFTDNWKIGEKTEVGNWQTRILALLAFCDSVHSVLKWKKPQKHSIIISIIRRKNIPKITNLTVCRP